MAGFDNDVVYGLEGLDIGEHPNTTSSFGSFEKEADGSEVNVTIYNTSDTANSTARHTLKLEGTNSGDSLYNWDIGSVHSWGFGPDTSADPRSLRLFYATSNNAGPDNYTNLPLRCEALNVVSGNSRTVARSNLVVACETTGSAYLGVNANAEAGVNAFFQMIQLNGTDDTYMHLAAGNGANWNIGCDGSTGSDFYITNASLNSWPPSASNTMQKITQEGEVTFPLTPCFLAHNSVPDTNQTGDNTNIQIQFDTEIFDQNSDFASNVFTAPVTGRYSFQSGVAYQSLGAAHTSGFLALVTSNRQLRFTNNVNIGAMRDSGNFCGLNGAAITDLDAGDTAQMQTTVSGGTKTVGIGGDVNVLNTYFSGKLEA